MFTIDVEATPAEIDIEFVEGPEAGNRCHGLYELHGERLTLCLGLAGASRPKAFATSPGSGHALERLRRASAERPAHVTGGTPQPPPPTSVEREDPSAFEVEMTPLLRRLEGNWVPVHLVRDGTAMPGQWLAFGSRTSVGNEVTVVFGGQVMVHAKIRIDERETPAAVDYLNLDGPQAGTVSRGIMGWVGDEVRFLMAGPGQPRPTDFSVPLVTGIAGASGGVPVAALTLCAVARSMGVVPPRKLCRERRCRSSPRRWVRKKSVSRPVDHGSSQGCRRAALSLWTFSTDLWTPRPS